MQTWADYQLLWTPGGRGLASQLCHSETWARVGNIGPVDTDACQAENGGFVSILGQAAHLETVMKRTRRRLGSRLGVSSRRARKGRVSFSMELASIMKRLQSRLHSSAHCASHGKLPRFEMPSYSLASLSRTAAIGHGSFLAGESLVIVQGSNALSRDAECACGIWSLGVVRRISRCSARGQGNR